MRLPVFLSSHPNSVKSVQDVYKEPEVKTEDK